MRLHSCARLVVPGGPAVRIPETPLRVPNPPSLCAAPPPARSKRLKESVVQFYAAEVLLALQYLHLLGFVYR